MRRIEGNVDRAYKATITLRRVTSGRMSQLGGRTTRFVGSRADPLAPSPDKGFSVPHASTSQKRGDTGGRASLLYRVDLKATDPDPQYSHEGYS